METLLVLWICRYLLAKLLYQVFGAFAISILENFILLSIFFY